MSEVTRATECITCGNPDAKYCTITLEPALKEPPAFDGFLCEECRTLLVKELELSTNIPIEVRTERPHGMPS